MFAQQKNRIKRVRLGCPTVGVQCHAFALRKTKNVSVACCQFQYTHITLLSSLNTSFIIPSGNKHMYEIYKVSDLDSCTL